ncbi:MAG TPA: hypothetical protein VIN07_08245 [Flavipsychrobacter sp.]
MSQRITATFTDGVNDYTFIIEPVRDEILSELYYMLQWQEHLFIMVYNTVEQQFIIQGAAPYIARELENELSSFIEGLEL